MERKFKTDTLSFKFEEVSNMLNVFKKGMYFMHNHTFYQVVSNPFYDLDSQEVHLAVQFEDYEYYLNNLS